MKVSMSEQKNRLPLLQIIQQLYARVVLRILDRRMALSERDHYPDTPPDLSSTLWGLVDNILTESEQKKSRSASRTADQVTEEGAPASKAQSGTGAYANIALSELSRYFKQRMTSSTLKPGIKEQLIRSAWEHLHRSIRLAREGESRSARLHAEIANQAIIELARYMPEDDYQGFINEIKNAINR